MKPTRLKAVVMTAAAALCCSAAQSAAPSRESEDAVRLRWLPDCGPDSSERPYFSVEVRDDGRVRYEGHDGTKIAGVRESRIDGASARRLKAKAGSFVRERKALKESEKQFERGYFCLEASMLRGGEAVATYARRSDVRRAQELLREVGKRIEPQQWACPARYIGNEPLYSTGYCSKQPAFSLALGGRTGCDVSQELFVYENGTIYSLAYRSHVRGELRDRYYQVDPGKVADLIEKIRTFERAAMEIIDDPPGRTQKIYYRYKPADVQAIRDRLARLADIEWLSTHDAADCDQYPGPSTAIHLREDLDVNTSR